MGFVRERRKRFRSEMIETLFFLKLSFLGSPMCSVRELRANTHCYMGDILIDKGKAKGFQLNLHL